VNMGEYVHENANSCRIRSRCGCVTGFQGVLHERVREYEAGSYVHGRVEGAGACCRLDGGLKCSAGDHPSLLMCATLLPLST